MTNYTTRGGERIHLGVTTAVTLLELELTGQLKLGHRERRQLCKILAMFCEEVEEFEATRDNLKED